MKTENQLVQEIVRINPFANNMNEVKVITNMEIDNNNNTHLSKEEENNILTYCKNKLYEMQTYIKDFTNIEELYNYIENGFAECNWSDDTQINDDEKQPNHNIHNFTFVFDQIMIDGYITPYGTILSKIVTYNPFNEEGDLYSVNTDTNEIILI